MKAIGSFNESVKKQNLQAEVQQREREARAKNIIVHGFPESSGVNEEKEANFNTIRQLMLEVNVKPESNTRKTRRK